MSTKAATLQLIYYQNQQETVYYIAEADPVKKEQHRRNIAHLYAILTTILKGKQPPRGFQPPPLPLLFVFLPCIFLIDLVGMCRSILKWQVSSN